MNTTTSQDGTSFADEVETSPRMVVYNQGSLAVGQITPLDITFTATIEVPGNWACVKNCSRRCRHNPVMLLKSI